MTDRVEPSYAQNPCIFVTGVWKSGNHLAYSTLNELGIEGPFNGISAHLLFGRYRWIKRAMRQAWRSNDVVNVGLETDAFVKRSYIAASVHKLSGRILGGHAAYSPELEGVLEEAGTRMICIRRDPRDILVSFADWIGTRPDFYLHRDFANLSRNGRIVKLLRGGKGTGYHLNSFSEVLARSEGWLNSPNVLQISFEELIGDRGGGNSSSQARTVAAIHDHVRSPKPMDTVNFEKIYGGTLTFNKGRKQRWRELESQSLITEINEVLGPQIAIYGYEA
ncbi:MAG: hypothetical protein HRU33_13150 [Rhodobacteraceae bacterium]|nr:hypothetical protein [Paracoccaceae bacterium]